MVVFVPVSRCRTMKPQCSPFTIFHLMGCLIEPSWSGILRPQLPYFSDWSQQEIIRLSLTIPNTEYVRNCIELTAADCHYYQSNLTLPVLRLLLSNLVTSIVDIANIQEVATNGRKIPQKPLKLRTFAASQW